jgi:hypothetical protein
VKSGRHLGRSRSHFQFENVCDRSEDGFASVVALLSVRFGETACLLREDSDPTGPNAMLIR